MQRYNRWVKVSHKMEKFDGFLVVTTQGLGKLDTKLVQFDDSYLENPNSNSIEAAILLTDHFTESYLWVLGAYEIIRCLHQKSNSDEAFFPDKKSEIKSLKLKFARLRMPLAKFEAAARYKDTDSHIAYPSIHSQHGAAWQLTEEVWVSRRELSDGMLELFESL